MRKMLAGLAVGLALTTAGAASANSPVNYDCTGCGPNANGGQCAGTHWRPGYFCQKFTNWVKAPCPSSAPTRRTDAPLAFKSHPYARSPRDYFMQD